MQSAAPDQLFRKDSAAPEVVLVPSLKAMVDGGGLNRSRLTVAIMTDANKRVHLTDKHSIHVSDGEKIVPWQVASLRELFRGNQPAPPDIEHYPPPYSLYFLLVENQLLTLCEALGTRTDQEMEEVYSELRRRPDGRSLGLTYDFVWQICALLVGSYPLSEAEFTGMMGALIRSTRRWSVRPISRNYVEYLRRTFAQSHSSSLRNVI